MELAAQETGALVNRLRRAHGQLSAVVHMLEQGRSCEDVVTQLAAVKHAVDRAGYAVISTGLKQCLTVADGDSAAATKAMEKLFLNLA